MAKLPTRNAPDPKACAVARAVGDAVHPGRVILFGLRARGDFNPESDVDLLVITDAGPLDNGSYQRAGSIAHGKARALYGGSVGVDLVEMSVVDFHYGRRARNHVAGQAVRDGFDTNGDKVNYDNPAPSNWPDIKQRIANSQRCLSDLEVLTEDRRSSQELIGFTAQQALENALKGWISALDADYVNTHDLADLAAIVNIPPKTTPTPASGLRG